MILITGSLAFDYLMDFEDEFKNRFINEKMDSLSVSMITNNFRKYFGGTAGNIAHNVKLLDEAPLLMGTAGYDFEEYMNSLNWRGINTSEISVLDSEITASAFITSDKTGNQITFFHPGAMFKAIKKDLSEYKDKIKIANIAPEGKDTMQHYVQECKKNGIPYIFDPGQNVALFIRIDEIYKAWEIIDPVLEVFTKGKPKLEYYKAGSWGPKGATEMVKDEGMEWL